MTPIKQKAVIITETGPTLGLADVPKPGPGQILVEVVAAAQNPTDCQPTYSGYRRKRDSLSIS
jgi:NADPH:quinone reductase-like Zn-dependent oxidoreductase